MLATHGEVGTGVGVGVGVGLGFGEDVTGLGDVDPVLDFEGVFVEVVPLLVLVEPDVEDEAELEPLVDGLALVDPD